MEVDSPVLLVPLPAPDAVILFRVALLVESAASVGLGPQWLGQRGAYRHCNHWWTNMLYVNNLVPFKDDSLRARVLRPRLVPGQRYAVFYHPASVYRGVYV